MKSPLLQVNDPGARVQFLTHFLPEAIERLREDAVPHWGEMTAQHMVEHLLWAFELSIGKAEVTCDIPESQRDAMKAWLYDERPSPRGFKNPKLPQAPGPLTYASMSASRRALREAVDQFAVCAKKNSSPPRMHPLFGALRTDEWERVHFKHSYHHLLQFGLVADEAHGTE